MDLGIFATIAYKRTNNVHRIIIYTILTLTHLVFNVKSYGVLCLDIYLYKVYLQSLISAPYEFILNYYTL
jgi:hypothetical protein